MKRSRRTISSVIKPRILSNLAKMPLSQLLGIGQLDLMIIRSDSINRTFLEKYLVSPVFDGQPMYFRRSYKCVYRGLEFRVYEDPNVTNSERYKLVVNPSKTSGYSELRRLFRKLKLSNASRMTRLDFSVLLDKRYFSIEQLFLAIRPLRKRWQGKYRTNNCREHLGDMTGYDYGKTPNRISAYYRGLKTRKRYIKRSGKHLNFELQISKTSLAGLGIEKLSDLKKVLLVDPYRWIKFYDIGTMNQPKTENQRARWIYFQDLCLRNGVHNARFKIRKEFGKNNIDRDFNGCFDPLLISDKGLTVNQFLLESFRRSMRVWFNS